ncbi:hypothetical protein AC1031_000682 [Aphanomyces cochlioides]|nr:hypothetical protein AC1031_000682 [Aphanomyces cochlioides]
MILGALIDAGAPLDRVKASLEHLTAIRGEWDLSSNRVWKGKGQIAATKVHVHSIHRHTPLPAPEHDDQAAKESSEILSNDPSGEVNHDHDHDHFHDHDLNHGDNDRYHYHSHDHDHMHDHHHDHQRDHNHSHSHHHSHEHDHDHHHDHNHEGGHGDFERNLKTIENMIDSSELSPWVKENSKRVFHCLAEAEASVHGTTIDKIHFHEVGAIDSIIDTIGSVVALELLQVEEVHCSFLPFSKGFVKCMHGVMPVPAPATLRLFMGIPVAPAPNGAVGELVTPTGASLMKALAKTFGQPPPFLPTASGSGAGTKDFPNHANIVRVVIGDAIEPSASVPNASWRPMLPRERQLDASAENVIVLETNLDDMNPQVFGHVQDLLFQRGALDVWLQPIQMKKNRPATLLSVLCHHQKVDELSQILFDETTTLGIRRKTVNRLVLRREKINVATPYGIASAKIGYMDDRVVNVQPEYEDCKALALSQNVPLKVVLAKVSSLAFEQVESPAKRPDQGQP